MYEMTDDAGVRDTLSFMIARDTMHQNHWIAAIAELEADGIDATPVPSSFPQELEKSQHTYPFWNHSEGEDSAEDRWAKGRSMDGSTPDLGTGFRRDVPAERLYKHISSAYGPC